MYASGSTPKLVREGWFKFRRQLADNLTGPSGTPDCCASRIHQPGIQQLQLRGQRQQAVDSCL
ncbi:MAG: hypothetical protein K5657_00135 [Desulfovibrio sp.]|nr:hypothetical protein [Desulfovibrio sp.]